ncbi:unnamed protein product [Calypogeia fissa]
MGSAVCIIVAVLAFWARGISADMCGVDSTDPESMNCNTGMDGSAGTVDGTVYESLTVARAPVVSGLSYNFYEKTCPNYQTIIQQAVTQALQANPLQAAGLTRIMFHDCFIQGCDASVLLTGSNSEQSYVPNQTLRQESFQLINQIKSTLEQKCPNTASCADIISQAAAEAIKQTKGPSITVPAGRRDGTSTASQNTVNNGLPSPFNNVSQNMPIFSNLGFDYTDFVALSGAHTLGQAHCSAFSGRLRPTFDVNLDVNFANTLSQLCPTGSNNVHSLDDTMTYFDNKFFKQVLSGDVLLTSDASMELDSHTAYLVKQYARSTSKFDSQFSRSFVKMSQLNVLTGSAGVIRKTCSAAN